MAKAKYKGDINLFEAIFKDKSRKAADLEKQLKDTLKICGCVVAAGFAIMILVNGSTKVRIGLIERETKSIATPEKLEEIEENKQLAASLKVENEMLQSELDSINASTKLTMRDIENIASFQPVEIKVTNFGYTEGVITLACSSTDELSGTNFANAMRVSNKFENIEYTGVTKAGEGNYTFTIKITLKNEGATEQEAVVNE
jgi:hypothetical protein